MKKVLILGANGQIARIVEERLLKEQPDVELTLFLRNASRLENLAGNILGIYNEVPGEFGRWNQEQVKWGLQAAINADKLLKDSSLDYTTIRIPWLNDRDEVRYTVTHEGEKYVGVSGSRQSVADVIVKMIADPTYLNKDSIGLADPDTQGLDRPVY